MEKKKESIQQLEIGGENLWMLLVPFPYRLISSTSDLLREENIMELFSRI